MNDLGDVVRLLDRSPVHRGWSVADIARLIAPPIDLGQCVVLRRNGRAVAFGSWALLDEEAELGYITGERRLQPSDWRSGDRFWLIDAVSPYGDGRELATTMRNAVRRRGFEGRTLRFRRNKGGERTYRTVVI